MAPDPKRTTQPVSEENAPEDPLERISAVQARLAGWDDELRSTVTRARANGYTWREIGRALDVSGTAALLRFGDDR